MIQEDQNQMCGNNSGGGGDGSVSRSSTTRKSKQNKVPQRGLGVAQLEKMRMKEQQKDGYNFTSPSTLSPTNSTSQQSIPLPNFTHTNNQRPSICRVPHSPPSPPTMPMNLPSPIPALRACSLPNTANFSLGSVPSLDPTNGDGFQVGWPSFPVHGNVSFPQIWHLNNPHEISPNLNGENSNFPTNLSLRYENCNVAALPDVLPRTTLHHESPSSNSLVNFMSSTSVLNFAMEPPSNQSMYSNYAPLWADEEKMMVGMKRPCPFPLDNSSIPTFHNTLAPMATHPLSRSDESTMGGNGGTPNNLDSSIPKFRETSCPSQMSVEPTNSRKTTSEFLSLAPPLSITSPFPNSRVMHFRKLDTIPYQKSVEDSLLDSRQGSSSQQTNLLSFFPPTKLQATSVSPPAILCNNDIGENIDLNLKL